MRKASNGFTIVELLVVIVVIGILSTIGYVVYAGAQKDARDSQKAAKMTVISAALEEYYDENGEYPSCEDMTSATAGDILDIDQSNFIAPGDAPSDNNSFVENCTSINEDDDSYDEFLYDGEGCYEDFCLEYDLEYQEESDDMAVIDKSSEEIMSPEEVGQYVDCPDGFLPVPGSATYNTTSFCIMKYEAKYSDGKAVSTAKGYQLWDSWGPGATLVQNQQDAIKYAKTACEGCHLVSEAEWMTIAQNIVQDGQNWTSGTVGEGSLYAGKYSDGKVRDASDDNDGWYGIPTNYGDITDRRRTFYVDNGTDDNNVIWDLAGNLPEWTDGSGYLSYFAEDDGTDLSDYTSLTWNMVQLAKDNKLAVNPIPSFGVPEADEWTSTMNVGNLNIHNTYNSNGRYFVRGGGAKNGDGIGIYNLTLADEPQYQADTGFRSAAQ